MTRPNTVSKKVAKAPAKAIKKSKTEKVIPQASPLKTYSPIPHAIARLPEINPVPAAPSQPLLTFVWGSGSMCELGLGPASNTKEVKRPRLNPLVASTPLVLLVCGGQHTLMLTTTNTVLSWGNNDCGVLGRDTSGSEVVRNADSDSDSDGDLNAKESTPAPVEGLPAETVVQLAATDNLSAVLTASGSVYAWGTFRCNEGNLGFWHDVMFQRTPARIPNLESIVQLAGGRDHLLALDAHGVVFAWGNGQQHQLGRRVVERTRKTSLEPREFGLRNVKYIASGEFHCFAVTHDDQVLAWGLNQFGQCGIPGEISDGAVIARPTVVPALCNLRIKQISAGEHHSLVLTEAGEVYAFGRIDMKEVGIKALDLPASTYYDDRGTARCVPEPTKLPLAPCKLVAAGLHTLFAVTADGVVFSWGFADTYAVGLGPIDGDVEVPTKIWNTATKDVDIQVVSAGGQFAVSGGVRLSEDAADEREDKYE